MTNIDKALLDPTSVYRKPMDVVKDDTLTREEKIKVLHRWEYDARELQVAEEENMPELTKKKHGDHLSQVLEALHILGSQSQNV